MRRNTKVQVEVQYGKFKRRFLGRINRSLTDGRFEVIANRRVLVLDECDFIITNDKAPSLRKLKQQASRFSPTVWKKPKYRMVKPCSDLPYDVVNRHIWKIKNNGVEHRGYGHNVYRAWELNGIVLTCYKSTNKGQNVRGPNWEIKVSEVSHQGVELVKGTAQDVMADIALLALYDEDDFFLDRY